MSAYSSTTNLSDVLTELITTLGAKYISLHTASPGTTGANEINTGSYARVATTWGSVVAGSGTSYQTTGSQVTINVPSSTTVAYWGIWTASSGGTYIDGGALTSQAYVSSGTYLLTPTLTAS